MKMERVKLCKALAAVLIAETIAVSCVITHRAVQSVHSEPEPMQYHLTVVSQTLSREYPESEQTYYNVPLSHDLQDKLRSACDESNVDMKLALAVIQKETNFQNLTGDKGRSIGYMQIQPRWHKARMNNLGVSNLKDPESNFRVGCNILSELTNKYTLEQALTAYNSGKPGKSSYASTVIRHMGSIEVEQ